MGQGGAAMTTNGDRPANDVELEVSGLKKHFRAGSASAIFGRSEDRIRAVDGVSFQVRKGEIIGLD